MTDVFKKEYLSRSEMFLLPLTGIPRSTIVPVNAYMFWNDYTIENSHLIVQVGITEDRSVYEEFVQKNILNNSKCHVTEAFDYEEFTIFIVDISEWDFDICQYMSGNYSKMTKQAKKVIQDFHVFWTQEVRHNPVTKKVETKDVQNIDLAIYAYMYPHEADKVFDNLSAMEYVIKDYDLEPEAAQSLRDRGELCSIYEIDNETLHLEEPKVTIKKISNE